VLPGQRLWADAAVCGERFVTGIAVADADGTVIAGETILDRISTTEAEVRAIRLALRYGVIEPGIHALIYSDSETAVNIVDDPGVRLGFRGDNLAHQHARAMMRKARMLHEQGLAA
jgi:ribonuclease HI